MQGLKIVFPPRKGNPEPQASSNSLPLSLVSLKDRQDKIIRGGGIPSTELRTGSAW